jgi:hypothetical protein
LVDDFSHESSSLTGAKGQVEARQRRPATASEEVMTSEPGGILRLDEVPVREEGGIA